MQITDSNGTPMKFPYDVQQLVVKDLKIDRLRVFKETRVRCFTTNPIEIADPFDVRTEKTCYFNWNDFRLNVNAPFNVNAFITGNIHLNWGAITPFTLKNEWQGPFVEILVHQNTKVCHPKNLIAYRINRIMVSVHDIMCFKIENQKPEFNLYEWLYHAHRKLGY